MELRRLNQKRLDLENEKPKNNNSPLNKLKPKYGNDKDKN
jgi:hypothetical protein